MGRHIGPKCRLCRREGVQLFLRGERCLGAKCALQKRSKPPGVHSWRRGKPSDYAVRLREKQKCKRFYGVWERQFRRYFDMASRAKGNTGENLLSILERRLDNVLTVGGFGVSRAASRQVIGHGHIKVNGRKVSIASYLVNEGDVIRPSGKENIMDMVRATREALGNPMPTWLELNDTDTSIKVMRFPNREEVSLEVQEQLIVEICSR